MQNECWLYMQVDNDYSVQLSKMTSHCTVQKEVNYAGDLINCRLLLFRPVSFTLIATTAYDVIS